MMERLLWLYELTLAVTQAMFSGPSGWLICDELKLEERKRENGL
jgi:hypothetical protein